MTIDKNKAVTRHLFRRAFSPARFLPNPSSGKRHYAATRHVPWAPNTLKWWLQISSYFCQQNLNTEAYRPLWARRVYIHCGAKKLHQFIFARTLSNFLK